MVAKLKTVSAVVETMDEGSRPATTVAAEPDTTGAAEDAVVDAQTDVPKVGGSRRRQEFDNHRLFF